MKICRCVLYYADLKSDTSFRTEYNVLILGCFYFYSFVKFFGKNSFLGGYKFNGEECGKNW